MERMKSQKKVRYPFFLIFIRQFVSPFIYILLSSGVVSISIGKLTDALFIFGIVIFNSMIGAFQEYKSEKSAESLQMLIKFKSIVRRADQKQKVESSEIVPGDIVLLDSGMKIPADIRLVATTNLHVDESLLTGESIPIEKKAQLILEERMPIADRKNMVFAGSSVLSGRAEGVVTATGVNTELGKISKSVITTEAVKPPLLMRMETFSRYLSYIVFILITILGAIAWLQGVSLHEVFFLSIALAVAVIPEGLPVAMTVALAISVKRMAHRNVIVRKLTSVEGLGSCTYIASDKTGTLTINKQTANIISIPFRQEFLQFNINNKINYDATKLRFETMNNHLISTQQSSLNYLNYEMDAKIQQLTEAFTICNEAKFEKTEHGFESHGDTIDVAFLELAYKLGFNTEHIRRSIQVVGIIPYESERKFSAVFYNKDTQAERNHSSQAEVSNIYVAAKGAAEIILSLCHRQVNKDQIRKEEYLLAEEGYRVITVAIGKLRDWNKNIEPTEKEIPPLMFLGFIGFTDPLRPEVKEAVFKCKNAGVQVGIITGDHPGTALAIGRQLGLAKTIEHVLTGEDLKGVEDGKVELTPELVRRIGSTHVFARVSPLQKVWIVESLREAGHFVAVTGDGINDAPALRKANIGVAMGSGSDVAKETASIIIADDNFASIEAGIEEGRYAYENVRKVIYLLLATGTGSILLFFLTLLAGLPFPLIAVQLLWLNLVTNGIQVIGLAFEKGEPEAMSHPPRVPKERILNQLMLQEIFIVGGVMGLVAFGAWWWFMINGWEERQAKNLLLLLMVFFGNYHTLNCRSERTSVFRIPIKNNVFLMIGVLAALAIHFASLYLPIMHSILQTQPVSFKEIIFTGLLASTVLISGEILKAFNRNIFNSTRVHPNLYALTTVDTCIK